MLFSCKLEWNTTTCHNIYNMNKPWKHAKCERSQTQEATYYMILFVWNVQTRQICRDKIGLVVVRAWGKGRVRSDCWWVWSFFACWRKCPGIRVVMVAQPHEKIVCFKWWLSWYLHYISIFKKSESSFSWWR